MQIIIVGCGKVGRTLAEQLQEEDTDITLIDINPDRINEITDEVDAMGVVGNGASINTLMEAGIETADILIAVTVSDEMNLLCCLIAQKTGHCHTIARVRNPIYSKEIGFIKERLGVTMIINPELAAAQEISKLLRFPSAIKIDTFARGKVELLKFKVMPEFELDGKSIQQITEHFRCDILFCAIEGKDYTTIPGGTNVIRNGDVISILATPQNAAAFFKKIGLKTHQVKNTVIVGGGTISYYLAQALLAMKIKVKVIEKDKNRCEFLSEELTNATIINGDGTDPDILKEEGIETVQSFIPLTGIDEENIMLTLYAKQVSKAKVVTKIINNLDLGSLVYPKYITSEAIIAYVRAKKNSMGSNIETLYHMFDSRVEAIEFIVEENSKVSGVPIKDLKLKKDVLISFINHNGHIIIPTGNDEIEDGDTVMIVTKNTGFTGIDDIVR